MANLIDIRRRIKSTKNTQQITKAMKMVSASRLRRASERAVNARPYANRLRSVHDSILARTPEYVGPLYEAHRGKTLLIIVGGDKGLCGSFNSNVFKRVTSIIRRQGEDHVTLLPIGRKAVAFVRRFKSEALDGYPDVFRSVDFSLAEEITDRLTELYKSGRFQSVMIVFNRFVNVMVQEVTENQLLPLKSANSDQVEFPIFSGVEHLAEPGLVEILDGLAPRVVMNQVFQAVLESCAAEHAARMTAMDSATKNAKSMIERLTLEMNKARQAAITKELIEVVSGAAAL